MKIPSYLYRNRFGTFYFRFVIPADLRQYFPNKNREFRRSLHTTNKQIAIRRCRIWSSWMTTRVEQINGMTKQNFDPKLFPELTLRGAKIKFGDIEVDFGDVEFDPENLDRDVEAFKDLQGHALEKLGLSGQAVPTVASTASPRDPNDPKQALLSDVVKEFLKAHTKNPARGGKAKVNEKTAKEYRAQYGLITALMGDPIFSEIDDDDVEELIDKLCAVPTNFTKRKKKLGVSNLTEFFEKDIVLDDDERISVVTVNKHITRLSSLFKWAPKKYGGHNCAQNKQLPQEEREDEQKPPYSEADLQAIFYNRLSYHLHPHYHWVPIIGLFTGARLNEICQLHVDDIRKHEGIWVIDINNAGTKRLKNKQSRRLVPIHSTLQKLQLIQFAEKQKKRGHTQLFPELKRGRDGHGMAVSKWFTRFSEAIENSAESGIGMPFTREGKSFHSFRHTVSAHLNNKKVDDRFISALLGHKDTQVGSSFSRYAGPFHPSVMEPIVEGLDFGLEFTKLRIFNKEKVTPEDFI